MSERRPSLPRVNALALAALLAACGAPPEATVGPDRVAPAVEQALREGRTARAIVTLDDTAAGFASAPSMGAALDRAVAAAETFHRAKASVLAGSSPEQLRVIHGYAMLPALHVELRSTQALAQLLARPEVLRVAEDVPHQAFLAQSLPLIGQPMAASFGATGAGTAVAVLDTGVDYTRPAFGSCSAPGVPGCRVVYANDFAPPDDQRDASGHGTNVAAIVAAVAPGTRILALDVFDGQYAYTSDLLEAIDWTIQARALYGIVAINLSLGSGGSTSACSWDPLAGAVRAAREAGILTVVAAGNDGSDDRLASPACIPEAVSVGAVYDADVGGIAYSQCTDDSTAADRITCFSNSSPQLTVLAPGALIRAGGITMAGTSQAAPHVAGALAALRSVLPSAGTAEIVAALRAGPLITDPRNGVQTPRVDFSGIRELACAPSRIPPELALKGAGDRVALPIDVPARCAWQVTGPPWLTLSAAQGTGPATLTVSTGVNLGAARSGTLTVGGVSSAVTQPPDESPPAAGLTILGGPITRSLVVGLAIAGSDVAGVDAMCLSNGSTCPAWQPYATSARWTLASGTSGARSVHLWIRDRVGNVTEAVRTVTYDVTGPVGGSAAAFSGAGAVTVQWSGFSDPVSGVLAYRVVSSTRGFPASCGVGALVYSGAGTSFVHGGLASGVTTYYLVCATDRAGNTSAGVTAVATAR